LETNFINLYPQYNPFEKKENNFSKLTVFKGDTQEKPDQSIKNDINSVKNTFKEFQKGGDEYFGQISKYDNLVKKEENKNKSKELAIMALSSIPYFRRIISAERAEENHDLLKAAGIAFLMLINVPEDFRDLSCAASQIKEAINNGSNKAKIPYTYQPKFSFFRGTLLEPLLKLSVIGKFLYKRDKTLFDTTIGKNFLKMAGFDEEKTKILKSIRKDSYGNFVTTINIEGSFLAKVLGRAMLRVPILTVLFLSLLELPSILKAFSLKDNPKTTALNGLKQVLKSGINVSSIVSGSSIFGALLYKKGGPVGSLIGIGVGSSIGSIIGNYINKNLIDKA